MQVDAQHQHYQEQYAGSAFDVVLVGDQAAGRLYVARWPKEIRIIDRRVRARLARPRPRHGSSPTCSARRAGAACPAFALRATAGSLLTIHVERFNPALRLYERLGFTLAEDKGVYLFLSWGGDNSQRSNDPTIQGESFETSG